MIKKGSIITVIFIFSTFVQLISQIVVTRIFGANLDLDVFLAAVTIPTILVTVIYGTINDAFLPLLGEKKVKDPDNVDNYFFSYLIIVAVLSFILTAIFVFLTDPLASILYNSRSASFISEVSTQMRFMFFSIPLAVISTFLGAYYYAHQKLMRFPLAQLLGSITNVLIIIYLSPLIGIWALVTGFVVNILFQICFVIPSNIIKWNFKSVNILPFLIAWIPLLIGSIALRTDTLLIRSFSSEMPTGYIVYLNLISKLFSLATGVMTIGIQVVLLPHLIQNLAEKKYDHVFLSVKRAKLVAVGVSIIITTILSLITPLLLNIFFLGGKFTAEDIRITTSLIPYFMVPAIGWGINSVFFQPLLALKKQKELGLLNVCSVAIAWTVALVIKSQFGVLAGMTFGLITLLFCGIIGSELLWQHYKKQLVKISPELS